MRLFSRQRNWPEICQESQMSFMIGRLLGANEMAVALLPKEDSETAKTVATVLERGMNYFYEEAVQHDS